MEKCCPKHPKYKAILRPRAVCAACWWMWLEKNPLRVLEADTQRFIEVLAEDSLPEDWDVFSVDSPSRIAYYVFLKRRIKELEEQVQKLFPKEADQPT